MTKTGNPVSAEIVLEGLEGSTRQLGGQGKEGGFDKDTRPYLALLLLGLCHSEGSPK